MPLIACEIFYTEKSDMKHFVAFLQEMHVSCSSCHICHGKQLKSIKFFNNIVMQQHTFPIKHKHSFFRSAKHSQITFSHFLIFSLSCSKLHYEHHKMSLNEFFLRWQFLIILGFYEKKKNILEWRDDLFEGMECDNMVSNFITAMRGWN